MSRRFLCDLKVAELRSELEKRGLDKSGVKPILMERLKGEGYDPTTFNFKKSNSSGGAPPGDGRNVKVETSAGEVAVGRSESHLTSVSEGSIGATEASEIEEKPKEDANEQSEDATTFVVRVGETEDDLDYDIKGTLASAEEHQMETKTSPAKNVDSEASITSKQMYLEKQPGKLQSAKASNTSEQAYLRVSNLKMPTKAVDLKQFFSAHGKVISGKILASTRAPGGCVGFLKMASGEDAAVCVKKLDGTEFNGKIIKVEVADKVPSSVSKAPKNESLSGLDKPKSIGTSAPSKSRRFRGEDVGNRAVASSRPVESSGGVGSASPSEHLHRRSARNMLGRYRKSALINSHLTRSLRRAQNLMHPAGGSATVSTRSVRFRQNRRRISDQAEAPGSDPKRSRFKIPYPRVHYYESLPAFTQYDSSRIRCGERSEREAPYEHRCRGTRDSYPIRTSRDDSYSAYSADAYYRRGSRFASPQDEIPSRNYVKPVVYRRPPADRFDVPMSYAGNGGGGSSLYRHRMRCSNYFVSSGGIDSARPRPFDVNYRPQSQARGNQCRAYQSSGRIKKDNHLLRPSRHSNEREINWQASDPSTSHRHHSRNRSRSPPPSRTGRVSRSRSPPPLPPPVRYTRRASPPPTSSSLASHKHRPNYEASSTNAYPRHLNSGGSHQGYSQASASIPSSSRNSQKVSHIIDYGHRSSATKPIPSWQSSSRSQNPEVPGLSSDGVGGGSRGGGGGYPIQWRSSGYGSRQQTRY
ncbi:Scaffold attachment factor B1 [Taenia crassiceps]|uniref:Scaffold attachment factor B1 n=1 Tax=Taenia crassiceps TaxID=6207 RepID=A0ABR4Q5P5_9CEST